MNKKINVNGNEFVVELRGEGEPLLLIAGFTADRTVWGLVIDALAKNYSVMTFDNRGVGQSGSPDFPYTIEMMAEDAYALAKEVYGSAQKINIVGHSMGGAIAQMFAYKHPEYVKSCVIANSFPKLGEAFRFVCNYKLDMYERGIPTDLIDQCAIPWAFSETFLSNYAIIEQFKTAKNPYPQSYTGYKNQLQALLGFDSIDWLDQLRVPCGIIAGESDIISTVEDSKKIQAKIPGAKLHIMKGVGHVAQVERPDEFVQHVRNMIS